MTYMWLVNDAYTGFVTVIGFERRFNLPYIDPSLPKKSLIVAVLAHNALV